MNARTERYSCFVSKQSIIQYLCKILHDDRLIIQNIYQDGLKQGISYMANNKLKALITIYLFSY